MAKAPDFDELLSTLVKVALAAGDMILKALSQRVKSRPQVPMEQSRKFLPRTFVNQEMLYVNFQELIALSNGCCS